MFIFIVLFVLLLLLVIAARYWGVDSTDTIDSCEWERRRQYQRSI